MNIMLPSNDLFPRTRTGEEYSDLEESDEDLEDGGALAQADSGHGTSQEDEEDDTVDPETSVPEEPVDLEDLLNFDPLNFGVVGSAEAGGPSNDDTINEDDSLSEPLPGASGSVDLLPGEEIIPGSRLANLFAMLDANRALQETLKAVTAKVERLVERNWNDNLAVSQQAPKQVSQGVSARAPSPSPEAGSSRYWRVHGLAPETDPSTAELAARIRQLPPSFERTRWSQSLIKLLKTGVLSEVQHLLTERALTSFHELQEHAGAGAGGEGGSGDILDLDTEFSRIKTVDLESDTAQALIAEFGPQEWQRISISFVKDRSAADCRIFYLHNLAPKRSWPLEESEALRRLAEANDCRHWDQIAIELGTGRTAAQCLQHFLKFSKPQHMQQRTLWSAADDEKLRKMVEQFGTKWVRIAEAMGNRFDRHQLRDRWHGQTQRQHSRNVGRWEADEDDRLLQAVQDLGLKWPAVAFAVGTRTAQQCRERYSNVLNPELKLEPFTSAEEELLRSACEEQLKAHGRIVWVQVAKLFPGRTDELIRRAWRTIEKYGEVRIASVKGKSRAQRQAPHGPSSLPVDQSAAVLPSRANSTPLEVQHDDGAGPSNQHGVHWHVQSWERDTEAEASDIAPRKIQRR